MRSVQLNIGSAEARELCHFFAQERDDVGEVGVERRVNVLGLPAMSQTREFALCPG